MVDMTRFMGKGQGLAEYGFGLALVVLVCIGALITLSTDIQSLFGASGNGMSAAILNSSQNTQTTGGNAPPGDNSTGNSNGNNSASGVLANAQAVTPIFNPQTGQFEYQITRNADNGTETTSGQGVTSQEVALALTQKIADLATKQGSDLPPELQQQIQQLSILGAQITAELGKSSLDPTNTGVYTTPEVEGVLQHTERYLQFSALYSKISANPASASVAQDLASFAAPLSQIALIEGMQNTFGNFNLTQVDPSSILTYASTYPNSVRLFETLYTDAQTALSMGAPPEQINQQFRGSVATLGQQYGITEPKIGSGYQIVLNNTLSTATPAKVAAKKRP